MLRSLLPVISLSLCTIMTAHASELVYFPKNPSFGGNPLNGTILLNQAEAQNKFKAPKAPSSSSASAPNSLRSFNSMLQSAILSRTASAATASIIGDDGKLKVGTVNTADFSISVSNIEHGALQVTTTDKLTGQTTQFEINQP